MMRMERAGKPRHRWVNPRGRESGSERVNGMSDCPWRSVSGRIGKRFKFKKVATESLSEVPNDRDCVIVCQANFGKE